MGRFLSEDPVRDGNNWYVYCNNNPVRYVDPSGEIAITTLILIGSAVIALVAAVDTACDSYNTTGKVDWVNTITTGRSINKDKVAIIKVTIPESTYNQLHHMNLDATIFKSGTPVVEPEILDFLIIAY